MSKDIIDQCIYYGEVKSVETMIFVCDRWIVDREHEEDKGELEKYTWKDYKY